MSAGIDLWRKALARQPELGRELKSAARTYSVGDDGESSERTEPQAASVGDLFAGLDDQFGESSYEYERPAKREMDGESIPVVEHNFEEQADLWLTRSRTGLEHAILSLGLTRDVLPTKRPVLVFGSRRKGLQEPEYHRVAVCRECWPTRVRSTSRLSATEAAEILARSGTETSLMTGAGFSGCTVAVEVPNPLIAEDRWIVIWPNLAEFPTRESEERPSQWRYVRRVVWWVNQKQIGPRGTLDWLSWYWPEVPVRVALFGATFFVHAAGDNAQSRVLPRVRRALSKFELLRSSPWVVAGP